MKIVSPSIKAWWLNSTGLHILVFTFGMLIATSGTESIFLAIALIVGLINAMVSIHYKKQDIGLPLKIGVASLVVSVILAALSNILFMTVLWFGVAFMLEAAMIHFYNNNNK